MSTSRFFSSVLHFPSQDSMRMWSTPLKVSKDPHNKFECPKCDGKLYFVDEIIRIYSEHASILDGTCPECGSRLKYVDYVSHTSEIGKYCTNPKCGVVVEKLPGSSETIGTGKEHSEIKRKSHEYLDNLEKCYQSFRSLPLIDWPQTEDLERAPYIALHPEYTSGELAAIFKRLGWKPSTAKTIKKYRANRPTRQLEIVILNERDESINQLKTFGWVRKTVGTLKDPVPSNPIHTLNPEEVRRKQDRVLAAIPPYAFVEFEGTPMGRLLMDTKDTGTGRDALCCLCNYARRIINNTRPERLKPTRKNIIKFFQNTYIGKVDQLSETVAEDRFNTLIKYGIIKLSGNGLYRYYHD